MSNYPNMSYCMNENTLLAMQQIIEAIDNDAEEFWNDMSREERRAFEELYLACEDFMSRAEKMVER